MPRGVELRVAEGERLLDAFDETIASAGLPTACRAGNCGACLVSVERGASALIPPGEAERETLRVLGAVPDQRLGCQLQVRAGLESDSTTIWLVVARA